MTEVNSESALKLFDEGKYAEARESWERFLKTSGVETIKQDALFNIATCYASEGHLNQAIESLKLLDISNPDVLYNLALCHYKLALYEEAKGVVDEALNLIQVQNPELSTGSETLNDTLLVQSINLKAAILYKLEEDSLECLKKIPYKDLSQFDCVTLHNTAIYASYSEPKESIRKLEHLVKLMKDSHFAQLVPKETVKNLLILYIYNYSNDAASALLRNESSLVEKNLDDETLNYFRCCIEANGDQNLFDRFERLFQMLVKNRQQSSLLGLINSQQASILWNNNQFEELEEFLLKRKQYATDELGVWSENMAHTLFMQDNRYEECRAIYEELMLARPQLGEVEPIILCNLCISYILSGKNNDAETLIKDVEVFEEGASEVDSYKDAEMEEASNLTLINLAIGTLYCVKSNYDFGLSRIIKSLTPVSRKLTQDTWFVAKRCILSFASLQCRQMIYVQDQLFNQAIEFLVQCEQFASTSARKPVIREWPAGTLTCEARLLRAILVKMFHD